MEERKESLKNAFLNAGLELSDQQLNRFYRYFEMLVEKNKVMNLTAITEYKDVVEKHFLDSCMLWTKELFAPVAMLKTQNEEGALSVIDVGTGAGFPGVPLKIFKPEISLTLLDTLNKRLEFLKDVLSDVEIKDVTLHHDRAEDGAKREELREKFDIATSRAVSRLSVLTEYCLPYVKVGGMMIAYKSGEVEEELSDAENAIRVLGGRVEKVAHYEVPGTDLKRSLVYIRKILKTPEKYPRKSGKVEKNPL